MLLNSGAPLSLLRHREAVSNLRRVGSDRENKSRGRDRHSRHMSNGPFQRLLIFSRAHTCVCMYISVEKGWCRARQRRLPTPACVAFSLLLFPSLSVPLFLSFFFFPSFFNLGKRTKRCSLEATSAATTSAANFFRAMLLRDAGKVLCGKLYTSEKKFRSNVSVELNPSASDAYRTFFSFFFFPITFKQR